MPASSYWNIIDWMFFPFLLCLLSSHPGLQVNSLDAEILGCCLQSLTSWLGCVGARTACLIHTCCRTLVCGRVSCPYSASTSAAAVPGGVWHQSSSWCTLPCSHLMRTHEFTAVTVSFCPTFHLLFFLSAALFLSLIITFLFSIYSYQMTLFIMLRGARTNWEEMSMRMKSQQHFLDWDLDASLGVQES